MVARPRHDVSAYADPLISERAIDEPRSLKVIYIGAGVSGITAAIVFPKYVPNIELIIYEKNAGVGGTWFENRYPGCVFCLAFVDNANIGQAPVTFQHIHTS